MAGAVSRWLGSVEKLPEFVQRMRRVQIENSPAIDVIHRYDTKQTLFYLDPPYVHAARGDSSAYSCEMTDQDPTELARVLRKVRGRAVLSAYRSDLYEDLFGDWRRVDGPICNCHSVRKNRQESLWMNFSG